jgi:RNA polymerase sigma-70 factor (ECF subfamily)
VERGARDSSDELRRLGVSSYSSPRGGRIPEPGLAPSQAGGGSESSSDAELVEALRDGDEAAFRSLVDQHSASLLGVAISYVGSRAVAEEVLQETWLGVLKGLDGFEGRSSLRTWIFRILTNTAKTRAVRESRSTPFSSVAGTEADAEGASVDPDRFLPLDHAGEPGHWALAPRRWHTPEQGLLSSEVRDVILAAIETLPASQRVVVTLRDIQGCPAHEVCETIDVSEGNQRVLLHRGRSKVRAALERYFDAVEPAAAPST